MSCLSHSLRCLSIVSVLIVLSGCDQFARMQSANDPDAPAAAPVASEPATEISVPDPMPAPEPTIVEPTPEPTPKVLPTLEELVEYSTTGKRSGKTQGVNFALEVKLTGDDLDSYEYFAEIKDASGGAQVFPMELQENIISLEKFVPNAGTSDKYMFQIKYGNKNAGGGGYLEGHKPEVFQSKRR